MTRRSGLAGLALALTLAAAACGGVHVYRTGRNLPAMTTPVREARVPVHA